ncbi:MAG: ABC transporter permease [Candidatus Woesearchaeota archaeon]|nr:ABC transporter permease [Candidatus Woesearchaeota archaeon]
MKTNQIIKKNIKLLLRSKVSTIVLVLGPLLLILLVGLSFSSNKFFLKMGAYSEGYSDLSESVIENLNEGGFSVKKYDTNETCVTAVKEQEVQACIVFPPNMVVRNDMQNVVKFYVDESKVNVVYLVMSKLSESFGEVTEGISKDLTQKILNSLFTSKNTLVGSRNTLSGITNENVIISTNSEASSSSLSGLNFDTSGQRSVTLSITSLKTKQDTFLKDTDAMIVSAKSFITKVKSEGSLNSNQTSDINKLQDKITELDSAIASSHNVTTKELTKLVTEVDAALRDLNQKLTNAANVNSQVLNKLDSISRSSKSLKEKADSLDKDINKIITDIDTIAITDAANIVSPITTEINPITESKSNLSYLFPSLLVILMMFIGILLPSTLIIMEKNSRAAFRIFTTPTKPWIFNYATYITSLMLVMVQLILILAVSLLYFNIGYINFLLILSLFCVATFFILLGMVIGLMFNTEEMAMLFSVSLATILLLTSGIVFPLESMPEYILKIAKYNPVVLGSETVKKTLLFNSGFESIKMQLLSLVLASLVLAFFILFRKEGKKSRKSVVLSYFPIGKGYAKNINELMISIENISDERFDEINEEGIINEWLRMIGKRKDLVNKFNGKKKEYVIAQLSSETKKKK